MSHRDGVQCPRCHSALVPVQRTKRSQFQIIRYRRCVHCGQSFRTFEKVERPSVFK